MAVAERAIDAQKDLGRRLRRYSGRWVAVNGTKIVASGSSAEEALERAGKRKVERVFRVPAKGATLL